MANNLPARVRETEFEVVDRKVYGNAERIGQVVTQLSQLGAFIEASSLRYDPQGTYALVRFRKPVGAEVDGAVPVRSTELVLRPAPHQPAPSRSIAKQWWFRPLIVVGALAGVVGAIGALLAWVADLGSKLADSIDGKTVTGFIVIVVIVAVVLASRGGGSGGGHGDGMGFHWTRCP